MDIKKLKVLYASQKSSAKRRGIEWQLTFDQWIEWWGEDVERRGVGHNCLQMQRFGDKGPYAIGNIKKGYPRDNRATWARVNENKKTAKAAKDREQWVEALMGMAAQRMDSSIDKSAQVL
jgi:hypothetical protein